MSESCCSLRAVLVLLGVGVCGGSSVLPAQDAAPLPDVRGDGRRDRDVEATLERYRRELDELREELRAVRQDQGKQDGETQATRPSPSQGAASLALPGATFPGVALPGSPFQAGGRRGLAVGGQTTIFDNIFNPAISLIGDFVVAGSDQTDSFERLNRFNLRDLELGFVGRVDPYSSYQVYLHFDEDIGVEIEEAYVFLDNALPDTFELKAGRFNRDFGKLSALHDHDLPMLDKPQVLQEYLGGSVRGTGVELHHWLGLSDTSTLRWSLGIANSLDSDAHTIFGPAAGHDHGHEEEGVEPFGKRRFENFGFHGRATAVFETGPTSTLQVGGSVAYAPKVVRFFEDALMTPFKATFETRIAGVDATYRDFDEASGTGFVTVAEALWSARELSDDGIARHDVDAFGFYAYAEAFVARQWSLGASGGRFEHAEDASERSSDYGAFATWRIDEFQRLRLEARRFEDPGQDSFGVSLQWTVILGTHGHGIYW